MSRHKGKIVINRMTRQQDRPRAALAPGYVKVDERGLPELLDFAGKVAGLVRYYAPSNVEDGDWSAFFLDDPAMVLASIAAVDVVAIETAYLQLERKVRAATDEPARLDLLREVFRSLLQLFRLFDRWLRGASETMSSAAFTPVREALASAIEGSLGEHLRELASYGEGAGEVRALGVVIPVDRTGFSPIWPVGCVCPDGAIYRGSGPRSKIDSALTALSVIFGALVHELRYLQEIARDHLDAALREGDHKPHLALFIAFARLFGTAQDTLNELSCRYVDFYYQDVLRATPRGPVGDSLYLTLTLAASKTLTSVIVPAGSQFSAGKDAQGVEIIYASTEDVLVGAATLDRLCALRITRGPPPNGAREPDARGPVQRVLATEIIPGKAAFTAFGRATETPTAVERTAPATLGFAIASPHLLLAGGERCLEIWIRGSKAAMHLLLPRLKALSSVTGLPRADLLRRVLGGAFDLYLSTAAGWIAVPPPYSVIFADNQRFSPEFALQIVLPASFPGIAPIGPAAFDATAPSPALPTLKAHLRQDPIDFHGALVYPLSLLDGLVLEAMWVRTEVSLLPDSALANPGGAIKTGKPFFVFGGAPGIQSYLDISHPEIFAKRIQSLGVRIDWFGLPPNDAGFCDYYRDYVIGLDGVNHGKGSVFTNESFQVSLEVTGPGAWDLGSSPPNLCLFRTASSTGTTGSDPGQKLSGTTTFDDLVPKRDEWPPHYDASKSAIRMTLIEPPEAFGDSVYAQNVLAAVLKSTAEAGGATSLQYPSVPWLPQAERVYLSYTACGLIAGKAPSSATSADPTGSEMYHLLPFGGFLRLEAPPAAGATLLPTFAHDGNLMLGFTGLQASQALTLLLHLAPTANEPSTKLPTVAWTQLRGNAWSPLQMSRPDADGTSGLRRTGPLTLDLPAVDPAPAPSTLLSADHQWIQASVDGEIERFPGVIGIHLNSVLASWQDNGNTGDHLRLPRPPGSVKAFKSKLVGIKAVDQPMQSTGGRPPETKATLPLRLGERLRHKQRAIVGWDYERLVLERFPAVDRVRTLPARDPERGPAPGNVTVVVLPGLDATPDLDPAVPALDADALAEIASYLGGRTSPFAEVHVVNPVYVRITVTASIEPAAGVDPNVAILRLNEELKVALSPWLLDAPWLVAGQPHPTEEDLAELIRTRSYVAALVDFSCVYTPDCAGLAWYFLTSAAKHSLRLAAAPASPTKGT